jgi:hypothetical protein
LLRKRKGGLEGNIFEDAYMVIEKNHIFCGIEVHQRDLRRQLNDIRDLQVADQKKATMTSLLESSTAAARRFRLLLCFVFLFRRHCMLCDVLEGDHLRTSPLLVMGWYFFLQQNQYS